MTLTGQELDERAQKLIVLREEDRQRHIQDLLQEIDELRTTVMNEADLSKIIFITRRIRNIHNTQGVYETSDERRVQEREANRRYYEKNKEKLKKRRIERKKKLETITPDKFEIPPNVKVV